MPFEPRRSRFETTRWSVVSAADRDASAAHAALATRWRGIGTSGIFILPLLIPFFGVPYSGSPDADLVVTIVAQCTFGLAGAAWAVAPWDRELAELDDPTRLFVSTMTVAVMATKA